LLKVCFSLFFCSSCNVHDYGVNEHLPTNIYNFDVGKYYTNSKSAVFLTVMPMNKFARFGFLIEEKKNYTSFFVYPFLFTLFGQEGKKNALNNMFAINNNGPKIEHAT
jgi:hypothetical protein